MSKPMKKLERTILKYELYDGTVMELHKPLYGQLDAVIAKLDELEKDPASGSTREEIERFLLECGATEAQIKGLELDHIQDIFADLSGQKKS